jgi:hypothetical protein
MMKKYFRSHAPWLAILALTLMTAPAFAEVPQYMTFSGRLVDDAGVPLVGEVAFELWIYDDPTGGNSLYGEGQSGVILDAQGNFSVLLGTGWDLGVGNNLFDSTLFSGADGYVEIVLLEPTFARLTPRVPIASVPWAFIAQQANEIVPDPNAPRFEDCGDGTVADHQTGLQWEKKTGTAGASVVCETAGCPDPHIVNNLYHWSKTGSDPDGNAFTDFLASLNGEFDPAAATGCFADRCDWRLPAISELQTILIGPDAAPGQSTTCGGWPCIDPDFAEVGGPTYFSYWSASTLPSSPDLAWFASFDSGRLFEGVKANDTFVRAVRAGVCN